VTLNRENSDETLNIEKDMRFAGRLRGGLASLREEHGDDAVLMVPLQQACKESMLMALEKLPEPEESSSLSGLSDGEEE